jgi:thioesterase domain-containing protein
MSLENVADLYALSPAQQLMLTHALAGGGRDTMREQLTCTLTGRVDPAALRRAWQTVVGRHAVLRTAFAWEGLQKPLQVVRQRVELPWSECDWRDVPAAEQEARWQAWAAADRDAPFDLTCAPLMRFGLIRVAADRYRCAWSCHHLVLDGWCLGLVLREVLECHEALRDGREPRLPTAVPFRNYVAWLAARRSAGDEDFWREYLAGYRGGATIGLLDDALGAAPVGAAFGEHEWSCPDPLDARLRGFAATQRVTLGTLVESCWCLLLARLTGTADVMFGSAVSARPPELRDADTIVGPFANAIPVRFRVDAGERWGDFLRRFQAAKAELHGREHAGLDQIRRWSGLDHSGPLFESLLAFENYPLEQSSFARPRDLQVSELQGSVTSDTPLLLAVLPGRPLHLRLRHERARCSDEAARRLLGHFIDLLTTACDGADQPAIGLSCSSSSAEFPTQWLDPPAGREVDAWTAAARVRIGQALGMETEETFSEDGPRAVILDAWGQPALTAVAGSLYVARGEFLAPQTSARPALPVGPRDSGWIDTGELAKRGLDGTPRFLGPRAGGLEVRGHRLDADWLCGLLRGQPLVADAEVVAASGPDGRAFLVAYVVPAAGSRTLLDDEQDALVAEEVRRFLATQLPREIAPRILALHSLPRLPDGGLDRAALPALVQPRPPLAAPFVAPRDFVEHELAGIWSELLGVYPVGIHDQFADLGGRSIVALTLIARIQQRFDRTVPIVALYGEPTIAHLADWLRRGGASGTSSCLVPIQPRGSRRPLLCVHPAGGTVFCYADLARRLGDEQPVYGLQARGIDGMQAPQTSVTDMAAAYVADIRARFPSGPYRLCGWSTGGIIAFEAACQLERLGEKVELLALVDAGMPTVGDKAFDKDDLLPLLALMFPGQSPDELRELERAGPERQMEYFRERAEMAQLVVGGAGNVKHVYDVFQANMQAVTEYRPERFAGEILLFRAAVAATPMHRDDHLGWGPRADRVVVVDVAGDHMSMLSDPALETVAGRLATVLAAP